MRITCLLVLILGCNIGRFEVGGGEVHFQPVPPFLEPDAALFSNPPAIAEDSRAPIFGGTLDVSGSRVVVADPVRDRVWLAAIEQRELRSVAEIELRRGDEPGRVAIAGDSAFVALRGAGELAVVNLLNHDLMRFPVCPAPRGIAMDGDEILVACATGELVRLAADGNVVSSIDLVPDLRDVVVGHDRVFVSVFRDATVLVLDGSEVVSTLRVPQEGPRTPRVAWRMRLREDGEGVHLLSQEHFDEEAPNVEFDGYGSSSTECHQRMIRTVMSSLDENSASRVLIDAPLPVDFVMSDDRFVVASAAPGGNAAFGFAPVSLRAFPSEPNQVAQTSGTCQGWVAASDDRRTATSVALSETSIVAYFRDSGSLANISADAGERASIRTLDLAPARVDTATNIFHHNPGGGLACASCHPEGRDDGHTWRLEGPVRRTQSLVGGIMGTMPFHWAGDVVDFGAIMTNTFATRMGGPELDGAQTADLGGWLDAMPAVAPPQLSADQVAAGEMVFNELDCASCHAGPLGTNNENRLVRGGSLQVPSLVGLDLRAPYFHDGCASDLESALSGCGASEHNVASRLEAAEVAALIAYLRSR